MPFNVTLDALNRPAQVGPLIIEPVTRASVALTVTRIAQTLSEQYRIPKITDDPSADWIAANTEIPASEATGEEVTITPQKLAGISYVGNELAEDTDPAAPGIIGQRIAVDIARNVDRAFFGEFITDDADPGYNPNRPAGLESIPLASLTHVEANPTAGLDAWVDAFYAAESAGVAVTGWVTTPEIARGLAKLPTGTGSNAKLLDFVDGRRTIYGAPVYTSPYVTTGSVWGIPSDRAFSVIRKDASVAFDTSVRFQYDQTAVRAIMRIGFGLPHTKGIVLIRA